MPDSAAEALWRRQVQSTGGRSKEKTATWEMVFWGSLFPLRGGGVATHKIDRAAGDLSINAPSCTQVVFFDLARLLAPLSRENELRRRYLWVIPKRTSEQDLIRGARDAIPLIESAIVG